MNRRNKTYYNEIQEKEPGHWLLKGIKAFNTFTLVLFASGLVVLMVHQVYMWALTTPFFELKHITISGNEFVSEEQILHQAKIKSQCNLFRLPVRDIEVRLMENCFIRKVMIRRRWPSGILVSVEERKPIVLLENNMGAVDAEGIFLPSLSPDQSGGLPTLSGIDVEGEAVGCPLEAEKVQWAVAFLKEMEERCADSLFKIDEINVRDVKHPLLYVEANRIPVRIGGSDCFARLKHLPVIFADLDEKGIEVEYIDARYHNQIVVKEKMNMSMGLESLAVKG